MKNKLLYFCINRIIQKSKQKMNDNDPPKMFYISDSDDEDVYNNIYNLAYYDDLFWDDEYDDYDDDYNGEIEEFRDYSYDDHPETNDPSMNNDIDCSQCYPLEQEYYYSTQSLQMDSTECEEDPIHPIRRVQSCPILNIELCQNESDHDDDNVDDNDAEYYPFHHVNYYMEQQQVIESDDVDYRNE